MECRLVVGDPSDEASSDILAQEARLQIPPFDAIKARLRAAYGGWHELDFSFLDPLVEEEPVLMAADTERSSDAAVIPSFYGEESRLVVTFRVDSDGRVTAFFVSEDAERVRFRVLKVGDRCFPSDVEGRVMLSGLAAGEVLGQNISIPPVLASVSFRYADIAATMESHFELVPSPSGPALAHLRVRSTGSHADRLMLAMRLEDLPCARYALIAVIGDRVAHLLLPAEGQEMLLSCDADTSDLVWVHLLDRS
ncbi:MAG: hypothetical protein ABIH26_05120 [Candidatus Eisenbacteria bacterium]